MKSAFLTRRVWSVCLVLPLLGGCSCWEGRDVRSQSPDEPEGKRVAKNMVADLAVPFGMFPVQVEAVGLVTGLGGTGSDPAPSPQRAVLLGEMQARGVPNPNTVLASRDTALVLIRGVIRPGIQRGDRFDLEVRIPSNSETTSLRGGYLLEARLKEMAVLNHQIHEGHVLALAKGPLMVDPSAKANEDRVLLGRARVLGGGVALKSRPLGLVLKPGHQNVFNASRVADAINKRFHSFEKGVKVGVAKAKTDEYIELQIHPRYAENIGRYVRVVRSVALRESATQRMQRLADLQRRLLDPVAAAEAALELEAIGPQGVEPLFEGLRGSDPESRFYAAEALAYLDRREAAEVLANAARQQPAFRVFALTALSTMDDYAAYEQLQDLLSESSAETRYGAFRALWAMNYGGAGLGGETLGDEFSYHVLDVGGPPMIHITRNRRPEIVLFGQGQRLLTPFWVNAGHEIMVKGSGPEEVSVARYVPGQPDQKQTVSANVDDVIRAIVELGGSYPDVVQALQEAKAANALASRFEVDALPEAGRAYHRDAQEDAPGEAVVQSPDRPAPGLFASLKRMFPTAAGSGSGSPESKEEPKSEESE